MKFPLIIAILHVALVSAYRDNLAEYIEQRNALIALEYVFHFDYETPFDELESQVDQILQNVRNYDILNLTIYPPEYNFRTVKHLIDQTQLLPILRAMPKGGIHHCHGFGDAWQIFQVGTYRDDCYIYLNDHPSNTLNGSFWYYPDASQVPDNWYNVNELRQKSGNSTAFDEVLFQTLQFFTPPESVAENDMWVYFDHTIQRIGSLVSYEPVWRETMLSNIEYMVWEDNLQFVEQRGFAGPYYDENGNFFNETQQIDKWVDLINEFNSNSNRSFSMKFIYQSIRSENASEIYTELADAVNIRRTYSDLVVGYDLVDEEDRYHTLFYYINDFMNIQQYIADNNDLPLPYYFHAGETDWPTKDNIFDAILLNTTRIGHGFDLKDYPLLMDIVRERGIAIEISPISNQLLRLVADMRNHPAIVFLNNDLPVTISNDDPIIYGYTGLAYDFYEAYMAWDSLTLKSLKQLAMNSILYSSYNEVDKQILMDDWQQRWEDWLYWVIKNYN